MQTLTHFNLKPNDIKRTGAKVLDTLGINSLGFQLQKKLCSPFIRAVNYHVIEPEATSSFESHLQYYCENYVPVDLPILERFLQTGVWEYSRPGIILSFDDGHISHYKIAAPILEKYGFVGWFFIPIGLMNLESNSFDSDKEKSIACDTALTESQLKYLDTHHIVGSHTESHCRLSKSNSLEKLKTEIIGSQKRMEKILGHPIPTFCWVGGEEESYSAAAAELIKTSYKYSFMTNNSVIRPTENPLQLQRTNIEAENPLCLLRFQLSGLMDVFYMKKRKRVNKLTA